MKDISLMAIAESYASMQVGEHGTTESVRALAAYVTAVASLVERIRSALCEACDHLDRLAEAVEGEGYSREECGGASVERTAEWRALAAGKERP